jgi:hypothetical protein
MKKMILGAMLVATPFLAQAKDYGAAGCGLGSILFEGQSGLGPHILAATTNNFYGTQTFAMTSGTLGCDVEGPIQSHAALYIDSNMENIARDMSRGEGEALNALAAVMGVQKQDQATFSAVMKANFTTIYSHDSVTSAEVMDAMASVMKNDAVLAKYVG